MRNVKKNILCFSFTLLSVGLSSCIGQRPVEWSNTLVPSGRKASPLLLAESGTANFFIMIPLEANTVEQKAAEDLAYWLLVISGAEFKIINEGQNTSIRNFISVGNTNVLHESGTVNQFQPPGDNGYAIAEKNGNLFLWGPKLRGVINAVYALFEEDMGCRWYTRNVNRIPRLDILIITPVNRSYTPVIKQRLPYYKEAFDKTWAIRNRTSTNQPEKWGGSYNIYGMVHTLPSWLPERKYFKEHPEYFAMINGKRSPSVQICLTNIDAAKEVARVVKDILRPRPDIKVISVSLRDGKGYCCCEKCLEFDKANGYNPAEPEMHRSGSLIYFINNVAEEVKKEFPDVLISTLAYLGTADPPTNIKPRKNVAIRLCNDIHSWNYPLVDFVNTDTPKSKRFKQMVEGWSAICDNIFIWEYSAIYTDYLWPLGNMNRIEPMVQFYLDHKVKGIMFQGDYTSFGSSRARLRSWVLSKYLWDPSRNIQTLMKDFATGMYGNASGEILEYYKNLDQIGLDYQNGKKGIDKMKQSWGIDGEFVSKALDTFHRAEQKADNQTILRRIKLEKLPVLNLAGYFQHDCLKKGQIFEIIDQMKKICVRESVASFDEKRSDNKLRYEYFIEKSKFNPKGVKWKKLGEMYRFKAVSESESDDKSGLWTKKSFDDSKWQVISGWKVWDEQGKPYFSGVGWYRQHFRIPADWPKDREIYLLFGGIDEQGIIYINGQLVHEHTLKTKKVPLSDLFKMRVIFPISQYIDRDKDNVLTVEVFNKVGLGGLYTPIFLVSSNRALGPTALWEFIISPK